MGRGTALHHLGRYEEAIDSFEKVFKVDHPTSTGSGRASVYADAWNAKGTSLYRMRKYLESIECYEKAIALDPKSWLPWYNKGNSLRELEDFDRAIRCYDKAIELWPEHAESWNNKGICLRKTGRLEEALACHEKAHTCDPPDVLGWYNKAHVQEDLGRIDDAKDSYENYLTVVPAEADTQFKHALERLRDLKSKTHAPGPDSSRYAYVVREKGAPIETGTIGYPDIETAILEALKQKSALYEARELSDEAYRGAIKEYQTMIKEHIQKNRRQVQE
jgi:tetratricopeptide (TPR) repeat protein